jgi:hypothetical protein
MIVARSSVDVRRVPGQTARPGHEVWVTGYLGKHAGASIPDADAWSRELFPDAYVIEQGPGVFGPPHFHRADEFQVVMTGSGTFGRTAVRPYVVHYAGAYTPYGPIDPGPGGIGYLTLRTFYDSGAQNMPEEREQLRAGKRKPRAFISERLNVGTGAGGCEKIIAPEPDGLAALLYHVAPGEGVTGLDPSTGGGQYWVVLAGDMQAGEATLPERSCVFVSRDEPASRVTAAGAPLDVLLLQFPLAG